MKFYNGEHPSGSRRKGIHQWGGAANTSAAFLTVKFPPAPPAKNFRWRKVAK